MCGADIEKKLLQLILGDLDMRPQEGQVPDNLGQLAETYRSAGLSAISGLQPDRGWDYLRVDTVDDAHQDILLAGSLGLQLETHYAKKNIESYWFMRKADGGPHIRLRYYGNKAVLSQAVRPSILAALDQERQRGTVLSWAQLIYEPEEALFGGPTGMDVCHKHFFEDSRFVVRRALNHNDSDLGPIETSLYALRHLLRHAGLDAFETWDTWRKVRDLRYLADDELFGILEENRAALGELFDLSPARFVSVFPPNIQMPIMDYLSAVENIGGQLLALNQKGDLHRGLRGILSSLVIFHWNRHGLPPGVQAGLAYIMEKANDPDTRRWVEARK